MIKYLIIINIITFIMYGIDKQQAIKNNYRISETTLLTLSLIGGSLGSILGMIIFHHKTKKLKFKLLNTIFLIIHILIIK